MARWLGLGGACLLGGCAPLSADGLLLIAAGAVAAMALLLLGFAWVLRRATGALVGKGDLAAFAQLPLGVPRGTVRAVLALLIVFTSLLLLAMAMLKGTDYRFPDALTGILGAVLGFYFSKGGTEPDAGQALSVMAGAQADAAKARRDATDAATNHAAMAHDVIDAASAKARQALAVGDALARVLPGKIGADVTAATGALGTAINLIDSLHRATDLPAAAGTAKAAAAAAPDPVASVAASALKAFAPVLAGVFPPAALLPTILEVGNALNATALARWEARVRGEPYAPEQAAPALLDGNAAVALVTASPVLRAAFADLLRTQDRMQVLAAVRLALGDDGETRLRAAFPDRFGSVAQEAFAAALASLREAARDAAVTRDVPAAATASVGGTGAVLRAVDAVRADPPARAALDAAMTTADTLRRLGHNPATAFASAGARR